MTRNNLPEHLTWLIASIPSNPPPPRQPGEQPPPQIISGHNNEQSLPETDISRSIQCPDDGVSDGGGGEDYSENPKPSTSEVPVFLADETMARLQSGPRTSKKSCLLSQPVTEPLRTPKAFQLLDSNQSLRGNASKDDSASGIFIHVPAI